MMKIHFSTSAYKVNTKWLHVSDLFMMHKMTAIMKHVGLMLSSEKATEAAALAVNQANVPCGKECAFRQGINQ